MVTSNNEGGKTAGAGQAADSLRNAPDNAGSNQDGMPDHASAAPDDARTLGDQMMALASNPFGGLSPFMAQFAAPENPLTDAVTEAQRQGMQTWMQANATVWESMQSLMRKQTEAWTGSMQRIQQATTAGFGDPANQVEIIREAVQKSLDDMREITGAATRSQAAMMADMTRQANEQAREMQDRFSGGAAGGKAGDA